MINVTAGGGGYHFLPDAQKLLHEATVRLPMGAAFAEPETGDVHGARIFVWEEASRRWLPLAPARAGESAAGQLSGTTGELGKMISGLLVAPDHPGPKLLDENSIKALGAANPAAGIQLIQSPVPNNAGTARVSFALATPQGRGAYSPSVAIHYSSERGKTWLGTDWDLDVPSVAIDLRWGVPFYDGTERYLLNGEPLVPYRRESSVSCSAGPLVQQYVPRHADFQRILRCGTTSQSHWEVTDKSGVRYEYGTDEDSQLRVPGTSSTATWFLRRVVDPNRNVTDYLYSRDYSGDIQEFSGEPFIQKYLARIEYTRLLSRPADPAPYSVEFTRDCGTRQDILSSGRTGFLVITRCLLTQVDVTLAPAPTVPGPSIAMIDPVPRKLIRRFRLEYKPGSFGHTVLGGIAVHGADDRFFYRHSFDYTLPELGDPDTGEPAFAAATTWKVTTPTPGPGPVPGSTDPIEGSDRRLSYTREQSEELGGSVGIGVGNPPWQDGLGCGVELSGGLNWDYPHSQVGLFDLNGDHLPDRVWTFTSPPQNPSAPALRSGGARAILGRREDPTNAVGAFGPQVLTTLPTPPAPAPARTGGTAMLTNDGLSRVQGTGYEWGVNGSCFASSEGGSVRAEGGLNHTTRKSGTTRLVADVNGDGFADLVDGTGDLADVDEAVYFPQLPSSCRDGQAAETLPGSDLGRCKDGLEVCLAPGVLCFGPWRPLHRKVALPKGSEGRNAAAPDMVGSEGPKLTASDMVDSEAQVPDAAEASITGEAGDGNDRIDQWRQRAEADPALRKELYPLNPTIRWKAPLSGRVAVEAAAQWGFTNPILGQLQAGKLLARNDGVTVILLRVTNPAGLPPATEELGRLKMTHAVLLREPVPPVIRWRVPSRLPELDVRFGESILLMVDPGKDVPVTDAGKLLDEVLLYLKVEYRKVQHPGQPVTSLPVPPPAHHDATGEPAYDYEFPRDFQASELPRERYWVLEPPIENVAANQTNAILGRVRKVAQTPTRVHVRIRCESLASDHFIDPRKGTAGVSPARDCGLGTVWAERTFDPDELTPPEGVPLLHKDVPTEELPLPSPFVAVDGERRFEAVRLLFEVDGENGVTVAPEAVLWDPLLRFHWVNDLEEVSAGMFGSYLKVASPTSDEPVPELLDPPWLMRPPVLYREHPDRELIPFRRLAGAAGNLSVHVEAEHLQKQLVVAVTGDAVDGEVTGRVDGTVPASRLVLEPPLSGPTVRNFQALLARPGLYFVRAYTEKGYDDAATVDTDGPIIKVTATLDDRPVPVNLLTVDAGPQDGGLPSVAPVPPEDFLKAPPQELIGEVPYANETWGGGHHAFFYGQVKGDEPRSFCHWHTWCTEPVQLTALAGAAPGPASAVVPQRRPAQPQPSPTPTRPPNPHDACQPTPVVPEPTDPYSETLRIDVSPDSPCGRQMRRFSPLDANNVRGETRFTGSDPLTFVAKGRVHATCNGCIPRSNDGAPAVDELRRSTTFSVSNYGSFDVGGKFKDITGDLGLKYTSKPAMTWTDLEFMDFNGDRKPDIIGPGEVVLTESGRELRPGRDGPELPALRDSVRVDNEVVTTAKGGPLNVRAGPGGRTVGVNVKNLDFSLHAFVDSARSFVDLSDVNGDGLPDQLIGRNHDADGTHLWVRLNLGTRFGEPTDWGRVDGPPTQTKFEEAIAKLGQGLDDEGPLGTLTESQSVNKGRGKGGDSRSYFTRVHIRAGTSRDATMTRQPMLLADIDGDGVADRLWKGGPVRGDVVDDRMLVHFGLGGVAVTSATSTAFSGQRSFWMPLGPDSWSPQPSYPPAVPSVLVAPLLSLVPGAGEPAMAWVNEVASATTGAPRDRPDTLELTGSVTKTYHATIKGALYIPGTPIYVSASGNYGHSSGHSYSQMDLADLDGDGLADRVLRTGGESETGSIQYERNLLGGANLLKTIHRPLHGRIDLEYTLVRTTDADPHPRRLLTAVTVQDEPEMPEIYRTTPVPLTFEYYSLRPDGSRILAGNFDRYEQEFLGFQFVETHRADGRIEQTEYNNRDYRLRGVPVRGRTLTRTLVGPELVEKVYREVEQQHELVRMVPLAEQSAACVDALVMPLRTLSGAQNGSPCDSWFVKSTATITRWQEADNDTTKLSVQRFLVYDNQGNVTTLEDTQDGRPGDGWIAYVSYDQQAALKAAHIVDRVTGVSMYRRNPAGRLPSVLLRKRSGCYDAHGNLLQHQTFADAAGTKIAKLRFEYDGKTAVGKPDCGREASQGPGFLTAAQDTAGYRVEYTPDPFVKMFPTSTRDSFGLRSQASYDFGWQQPTQIVDENNQRIVNEYDTFGRLARVTGPRELTANSQSVTIEYSVPREDTLIVPEHAQTTNCAFVGLLQDPPLPGLEPTAVPTLEPHACEYPGDDSLSVIRTIGYVDALGRLMQSQLDSAVSSDGTAVVGRTVSGRVEYDDVGRVASEAQPAFFDWDTDVRFMALLDPSQPELGRHPTTFGYDVLDRPQLKTQPGESGDRLTKWEYHIAPHPRVPGLLTRTTTMTDPEEHITRQYSDAEDRLVAVVQDLDGRDLTTSYDHLPTGELQAILDANSQRSDLEYDLAGRRTAVTTPDTGRTESIYDNNGNLVARIDAVLRARGQRINYRFYRNRLTAVVYPATLKKFGAAPPAYPVLDDIGSSITYTYGDDPAAATICRGQANIRGRICRVTDETGSELRSYDELGHVALRDRTLLSPTGKPPRRFVTRMDYDSYGRLRRLIYPDGEEIHYRYDAGGRASGATGHKGGTDTVQYVKDVQYDEFGNRTLLKMGNDLETRYLYEPTTRWLQNETIGHPGFDPLRNMTFSRDKLGNILTVEDERLQTSTPFLKDVSYTYTYDGLNRLDSSSMSAVQRTTSSDVSWLVGTSHGYDDVGNITSQIVTRERNGESTASYPSRNWTYVYGNPSHPNLPDSIGPYRFTYDGRGAMTSQLKVPDTLGPVEALRHRGDDTEAPVPEPLGPPDGASYTWDFEGRLRTSFRQQTPTDVTTYTYDSGGVRAMQSTRRGSAGTDYTLYPDEHYTARNGIVSSGTACPVEPCWDSLTSRTKHVFLDGQRVATTAMVVQNERSDERLIEIAATVTEYFHANQVGSAVLLTNASANRVEEIDYLPFGEKLFDPRDESKPRLPQEYRFDGKEVDAATGLEYFGARYYAPWVGRWTSADRLYLSWPEVGARQPVKLNLFAFGIGDPINLADKTGNDPGCPQTCRAIATGPVSSPSANPAQEASEARSLEDDRARASQIHLQKRREQARQELRRGLRNDELRNIGAAFTAAMILMLPLGGGYQPIEETEFTRQVNANVAWFMGDVLSMPQLPGPVGSVRYGSGKGPHSLTATLYRDGEVVGRTTLTSGHQTPQEKALGFPLGPNASHTEARTVRRLGLEPGDLLDLEGQYSPCNPCKGEMNSTAQRTGARINYRWPGGSWWARPIR